MMVVLSDLCVVESADQPEATCVVCGNDVPRGGGITASYRGRTLRFKCPGCYKRFEAAPERYFADDQGECCDGEHVHSPASEWT